MMSRASRMLKWPVAATVLLAAAPIAYAEPSTASTANTGPSAPADPARCGGRSGDFAGSYAVAGHADTGYGFDAATMTLRTTAVHPSTASGADIGVGTSVGAGADTAGTWQAGGGTIRWSFDGTTYTAGAADVMCTNPAAAGQVSSLTAAAADGSGTVTLVRR